MEHKTDALTGSTLSRGFLSPDFLPGHFNEYTLKEKATDDLNNGKKCVLKGTICGRANKNVDNIGAVLGCTKDATLLLGLKLDTKLVFCSTTMVESKKLDYWKVLTSLGLVYESPNINNSSFSSIKDTLLKNRCQKLPGAANNAELQMQIKCSATKVQKD